MGDFEVLYNVPHLVGFEQLKWQDVIKLKLIKVKRCHAPVILLGRKVKAMGKDALREYFLQDTLGKAAGRDSDPPQCAVETGHLLTGRSLAQANF